MTHTTHAHHPDPDVDRTADLTPAISPGGTMTTHTETDAAWLQEAVELAVASVGGGGGPFGAVVVKDGERLSRGQNRVTRDLDPTAHAEVVAIRAACASLGDFSLAGCTLYTSCEPCPLCVSASLWSRVDRVVYTADRHDAARGGFDDRAFYDLFATDRATWPMPVTSVMLSESFAPFSAWLEHTERTAY